MKQTEPQELVPLSSQQHADIDKATPRKRGRVVSSLLEYGAASGQGAALEAALTTVALHGIALAGLEVVKAAAVGIWHDTHEPAEIVLQGPFGVEAALLVERLAFYAIVPQPRKKELLSLVRPLLPAAGSPSRTAFIEFKRYLSDLQPLQSRHISPASFGPL